MLNYIIKRLLLIFPTLIGIMLVNFVIIQFAPGGPVEKMLMELQGMDSKLGSSFLSQGSDFQGSHQASNVTSSDSLKYKGSEGLDSELIKEIEKLYNFDKPMHVRFMLMLRNYFTLNFGESYYRNRTVIDLIKEKLPISASLGLWSTLIIYIISIPLGIRKAVKSGSRFDLATSFILIVTYAIPSFVFGIILIVLFAGGNFYELFPLRGLVSDNFANMTPWEQFKDYVWHLTLPIITLTIGGFATLTWLTKNSFLEELSKQYVITAIAKGASEKRVLYGHVFRNAMLIVIAGFPSAFISMFFAGSLLIETIFSLDGLGLLGYDAALSRDYPVMFATLFIFTILGLVMGLIGDLTYRIIDPRINFDKI